MADPLTPATPPYPTRFRWGMRIFLGVLLFDMIFRGFSTTYAWPKWADDLDMRTMPRRLPTRAEMGDLARAAQPDDPDPVREDVMLAFDSVWVFFRPWPDAGVRPRLRTWPDVGRWALVWVVSRLEFCENVVGINQEWPMFSPSASKQQWFPRARLVYADGSERIIRGRGDPEDLTNYSNWWKEKHLDHELKVHEGEGKSRDALGYCNLLAHRYAHNDRGAELHTISLFVVRYDLTPPHVDPAAWLRQQTGPPKDQHYPDFFVYDVASGHGKTLLTRYK